jgi:uncharacterized protein YbjT (DUF2867 family)
VKVAVLGGTGFVGSHIVKRLADDSHEVRVVTHRRQPTVRVSRVEYVEGAITNEESLVAAFSGCQAVVHAVGIIVESGTSTHDNIVVQGTANVVAACRKAGVPLLVFISALGTSQNSGSRYHKAKFAAEQTIIGAGIPYVIFRPSVIYGREDKFINMLASMIRYLPIVPVVGDGKYLLQPIFVDDLASMVSTSISLPSSHNRTYNAAGPESYTFRELLALIKKTIGKRRANMYLPVSAMRVIAGIAERLMSKPPITRDQLLMLNEGNSGDIVETVRTLGVHPRKLADVLPTYLR